MENAWSAVVLHTECLAFWHTDLKRKVERVLHLRRRERDLPVPHQQEAAVPEIGHA